MVRSRSRSPARRERHRSRSREREKLRDRERDRDRRVRERYRSRSRSPRRRSWSPPIRRRSKSPHHRRSRSGSRGRDGMKRAVPKYLMERAPLTEKDLEGKTDEEKEMMKMMGFGSFDTTKGKHVPGNNIHGVHIIHKRKYRQYMNRKGGFNRPLDFVA